MPIDAKTQLVALLGDPVTHSRSPLLHNAAFRHQGLNFAYVATAVSRRGLAAAVAGLEALHFAGANVTIPHKEAVRPLVDALSPQAEAVGAVNTLVFRRDDPEAEATVYGDNTDVAGFLEPLRSLSDRLRGEPLLVFGTGGAARAVVYALLSTFQPARLTLAARTPAKAERLAQDFAAYDAAGALRVVPLAEAGKAVRSSALVVNATPLGMHPAVASTPWDHEQDFSAGQIVYDLVYNPAETRLLRRAAARGATPVGGLEMLIEQAAAAYVQWTGRPMPTEAVRAALREKLPQE